VSKIRNKIFYFNNKSTLTYILLTLFIASISLFYYTLTSNDLVVGFTSDDAVYLLLADLYSFRNTSEVLLYDLIRQESYFPPLYPLILGLLGGDSSNPALAGNITITFLLISIFISGIWLWKETANKPISIIITLTVFLLPGTLILAQEIWSEFLFMVFLYGTFLLGSKKKLEGQDWLGMAVLIALSSLTRSIGISLVFAFCLLLINKRVKFGTTYAVISMAPFLFWNLARENYLDRPDYVDTFSSTILNLSPHDTFVLLLTKIASSLNNFILIKNPHIIKNRSTSNTETLK